MIDKRLDELLSEMQEKCLQCFGGDCMNCDQKNIYRENTISQIKALSKAIQFIKAGEGVLPENEIIETKIVNILTVLVFGFSKLTTNQQEKRLIKTMKTLVELGGNIATPIIAGLKVENGDLKKKLNEIKETYKNIVNEKCGEDEEHCTCVPALRDRIDKLDKLSKYLSGKLRQQSEEKDKRIEELEIKLELEYSEVLKIGLRKDAIRREFALEDRADKNSSSSNTTGAGGGGMNAKEWNYKYGIGQPIHLTEDDGSITATQTRSPAWELGDGTPVIKVTGKTGGYSLKRIKAVTFIL